MNGLPFYVPPGWWFAGLTVAVVVIASLLTRRLFGVRSQWKRLETGHGGLGVTLDEGRRPGELRREQWGKTLSRWQVGHLERKRADLAVLGMKREDYAYKRVTTAAASGGVAVGLIVAAVFVAGITPGLLVWAAAALVPVLFFGLVVPADTTSKADQRRTQVSFEFAQYLQLAVMFIKGGREWSTALAMAARVAKEPTFHTIALFMERGRSLKETPSEVFHNLGTFWHHEDIVRFASTIKTAEGGGSMKEAVFSQSESITERNLHTLLEEADRTTQRAGLPETGIVAIYMLYLMYPSLSQI